MFEAGTRMRACRSSHRYAADSPGLGDWAKPRGWRGQCRALAVSLSLMLPLLSLTFSLSFPFCFLLALSPSSLSL
uniref:Uncharacterized protein n=1 Tax=Anguilla anguilla TaxID=7936 RepID=A0A0E9W250_ANGAN